MCTASSVCTVSTPFSVCTVSTPSSVCTVCTVYVWSVYCVYCTSWKRIPSDSVRDSSEDPVELSKWGLPVCHSTRQSG